MFRRTILYVALLLTSHSCMETEPSANKQYDYPFQNPELNVDERVDDLVSLMTREEKLLQLFNNAPAIKRLGVPAYNWWNEALHGVARAGKATVFPQAIGLAATFNEDLMSEVSTVISDECTTCLNCVDVCPVKDTLQLETIGIKKKVSKKLVAVEVVSIFMLLTGYGILTDNWQNNISKNEYLKLYKDMDSFGHPTGTEAIKNFNKEALKEKVEIKNELDDRTK